MSMNHCLGDIQPMEMARARRKQSEENASEMQCNEYRSLAWTIMWEVNGTLPYTSFVTSFIQQVSHRLGVHDIYQKQTRSLNK